MIFDNDERFVRLLQNRSPEASQLLSTTSPLWFGDEENLRCISVAMFVFSVL